MLDDGPGRTIAAGGDPLAAFAGILAEADYRIGNLEVPVATRGQPHASKIVSFRAHPRTLSVLQGRFDAVSLANNHSGDYGRDAFIETMQHLDRAGIALDDVALWEINEAFAAMCVATTRVLGIDDSIVNVVGSGCSLGHPIAMTGARMVISLVAELRRRGGGTGVAAMCAGGGMSTALVLEVAAPGTGLR